MSSNEKFIPEKTISESSSEEVKIHGVKLSKFIESFKNSYNGKKPQCIIRSPGRVNLIGDHVDYHGFAVLPMAIDNSIWLMCSFEQNCPTKRTDSGECPVSNAADTEAATLQLANSDPTTYPNWTGSQSLTHAAELVKSHRWQNYVLCGYHGVIATDLLHIPANNVLEHAKKLHEDKETLDSCTKALNGIASSKMLIDSDLPAASGLSSSSALVCASALATSLLLRQSKLTKDNKVESIRIAASCSKYEHLVGTHGGGMDQAVIMTAQEGFAKYVEFYPVFRCHNVRLPKDIVWLVSHCGISYPKASTTGFNTRVLETKLGAALIAKAKDNSKLSPIKLDSTISLAKIKEQFYGAQTLQEMILDIRHNIFENRNSFTVDDICSRLELSKEQLVERFLMRESMEELQILSRCEHVLEEADRVTRFKTICETTADVSELGQLMIQSHQSLRDKFECSHPALDRLVDVALEAGALGSRLTGAGWGGCIVSMVEGSKRDFVTNRLREHSKFTFETEPHSGCEAFWIEN